VKTKQETIKALNAIREAVDADVIDSDIVNVQNKLLQLTQLMGLSAEAKASAKKILHKKELEVFSFIDALLSPSMQAKKLYAECFEESALLEYADRLNSALVHGIDGLRSVLSYRKSEMENSLK
jgi:hypothetical protein